ncbi:hypothetical protein L218DRAFT_991702 [Marasmius fiardii PR-910]|nr:hypothetical protein L218DRAFT_991702 [Marasmius fiardii PR-910]
MASAEALSESVKTLAHRQLVAYMDVFSVALLVYDVIINLHVEIDYIWRGSWSFFTVLYILQRYLPFFDTAALSLHRSSLLGIALSETVLTLRVWSVWRRSVPVAIGLVAFALACWVPFFVLTARFSRAMESVTPIIYAHECYIPAENNFLYLCWVLIMVYDTVTLVMIIIPRVSGCVVYYMFAFLTSLVNVIIIRILSPLSYQGHLWTQNLTRYPPTGPHASFILIRTGITFPPDQPHNPPSPSSRLATNYLSDNVGY